MAAEFKVSIGADIAGLNSGLNSAENRISYFVSKVNKIGELGDVFQNIGAKLTAGLTLPIVGLGAAAVKSYGEIEALMKGLNAVMGSAAAAGNEFEKLKEVAKLPGLGLEEAVRGSVSLQSAGFSADQARESLLAFGNALATVGKGKNELNFVILALTQLQNKSSGFGQDLRQLTEQLPQLRGALTDAFGTADSEAIAKLGVTGAEVVQRITKEFAKLPPVTGGIKNAFENLSDSSSIALSKLGQIIDKNLNITGLLEKVSNGISSLVDWFSELSPSVQTGILAFAGLAAALGPVLLAIGAFMSALPTILTGVGAISTALTALTGPIGLVVVGVGAVIAVFVTQWSKIKPIIINTINYFIDLYNESMVFRAGIEAIALSFNNLWSVVKGVARIIWDTIKTLAKGIITAFGAVGDVIKGAFTGKLDLVQKGLVDFNKNVGQTAQNLAKNLGNNIKGIFNDIGDNVSNFLDKTINGNKKARITDIKVGIPGLPEATEKEVENGVNGGIAKAEKKLKGKKVNIEYEYETTGALGVGKKEDIIKSVEGNLIDDDIATNTFLENVRKNTLAIQQEFKNRANGVVLEIKAFNAQIQQAFTEIAENSAVSSLQNLFGDIGNAIGEGGNVIAAIGKSLIGSFGAFLSQMGDMLIKYGTLAVAKGKLDLAIAVGGPTAIAAGIAAIAVGALLKVAGAALGSAASKGFGGGSGSSGGSTSSSTGSSSGAYTSSSTVYQNGGFNGEVVFKINGYDLIGVISKNQDRLTRLGN